MRFATISDAPFRHVVIDHAFDDHLVAAAAAGWPRPSWDGWTVVYDNPLERKRACNEWPRFSPSVTLLMGQLVAFPVGQYFPGTGGRLAPDCTLRGGGMHDSGRGDHLDLHEDSDHHPILRWRRRLNAVLFLGEWDESWGGHLELWDGGVVGPPVRVAPAANRLVLFEVGDGTVHGVPGPIDCPADVRRKSLAAFWFAPNEGGPPFRRPRARFVGRPGEDDPAKEAFRLERARL